MKRLATLTGLIFLFILSIPFILSAALAAGIVRTLRIRPGPGFLLLACVALALTLPLAVVTSFTDYLGAVGREWPLYTFAAIAWVIVHWAEPHKIVWRWFVVAATLQGVIALSAGTLELQRLAWGASASWVSAAGAGLVLIGTGLVLFNLRALQALARERFRMPRRPQAAAGQTARTQGDWTDTEITNHLDDQFGSVDYARVLVRRARETDTPIIIGIFGRWGSGKTSLMRLMQNLLEHPEGDTAPVSTLWVNVWQLSGQEQLWNAFLQSLLTQVHDKLPWHRRWAFDWGLFRKRVKWRHLIQVLVVNSYRIVVAATPILLAQFWPDKSVTSGSQLLAFALNPIMGGTASLILGLWLVIRPAIEAAREKVSLDLGQVLKKAPFEAQVSALQQIQHQFEGMVKAWAGAKGRLVVFIDDLDRCPPDKIPDVLEALKLFTTTRRCIYVMGLDYDVVRQGVAARYEFSLAEGAEYLEKIVQIPFHLPPLEDNRIEVFVHDQYPDLHKVCEMAPTIFSVGLEPNPRKVKRALNIYRTLLELAEVRFDNWEMDQVDPELLAKMIVIQSRHSRLYTHLIREPNFVQQLEMLALSGKLDAQVIKDYARYRNQQPPPHDEKTPYEQWSAAQIHQQLETLMTESPTDQINETYLIALSAMLRAGQARFGPLTLAELVTYIYLTGTVETGAERLRPSPRERQVLLGGDTLKILAQVSEILKRGENDQVKERVRQNYIKRLERVLTLHNTYKADERQSANVALDLLLPWTRQEGEPETVYIPAGEFVMGSSDRDRNARADEKPQRTVTLAAYRIGRFPVTNAQFAAFVKDEGYHTTPERLGYGWILDGNTWRGVKGANWQHPRRPQDNTSGKDDHPVVMVSHQDAIAYCEWLTHRTGKQYRLPTEAEWEKAARGLDGRLYPWGNEFDAERCNTRSGGSGTTFPVSYFGPSGDSPFGCADMVGNVWEWCADWYGDDAYRTCPEKDPQGPASGKAVVIRGSSYISSAQDARCATRSCDDTPESGNLYCGFRVVAVVQPKV